MCAGCGKKKIETNQILVAGGYEQRRQAFTQNTAARTQAALGGNVVVSNVGYTLDSADKQVFSTEYNAKVGSDVR